MWVERILDLVTTIKKQKKIVQFIWIQSHIGLKGNEMADFEAQLSARNGYQMTALPHVPEMYSLIDRKNMFFGDRQWTEYTIDRNKTPLDIPNSIQTYSHNPVFITFIQCLG